MKEWIIGFKILIVMTILTGLLYPLFLTLVGTLFMSHSTSGSFLFRDNKIMGSKLIGQNFESNSHFWGRPSAIDYNPYPSGASNLHPASKQLKDLFFKRMERLKKAHNNTENVPQGLLFASGSGIDPHISPNAAYYQIERIAKERHIDKIDLMLLVDKHTQNRFLGIFGQRTVNVLELNLELDQIQKEKP